MRNNFFYSFLLNQIIIIVLFSLLATGTASANQLDELMQKGGDYYTEMANMKDRLKLMKRFSMMIMKGPLFITTLLIPIIGLENLVMQFLITNELLYFLQPMKM